MPELADSDFVPVGTRTKDSAIPRFFQKACKNNFKSEREKKAVYDTKDYVEILTPGDRLNTIIREVQDKDKARWPEHWAAYKAGRELAVVGTPLEMWPMVDVGQVETLKQWNVRSVEDLAQLSDANVQKIGMGMLTLRQKAIVWLAEADKGAGVAQVVAENSELKQRMAAMEEQMKSLAAAAEAAAARAAAAPTPAPAAASAPAIDPDVLAAMVSAAVAKAMPPPAPAAAPEAKPAAKKQAAMVDDV